MSSTVGAIDRRQRASQADRVLRQLSAAISLVVLGLILSLAFVLLLRRLGGALVNPLSGGGFLLMALAIESAIILYRCVDSGTEYSVRSTRYFSRWPRSVPPHLIFSLIAPGLAALATLGSLTIPGTPAWALLLAWLLVISAEAIQWPFHFRPDWLIVHWPPRLRQLAATVAEDEEPDVPRGLVQQLTRTLEGDRESIHALAKAEILANDRFAAVHIAFCPPLAGPPQLSAHAIDTDGAEVRITQAEVFGVRLEVRFTSTKPTPRKVMIEILGSATAPKAV